ncbi:hypothetical protein DFJ58DRAFT_840127 [Suillus subalutaceus]|uniref:uncharacterized protein n=1 Tax=Suillus subalutaceus TaxID=48586 RepID=UPI001B8672AE|nr:uncharacterized protein DFJ58DRAFT_840127 [Suillus subalutaceus]KAG1859547.1 hypothetical protein DFJ58DRAFT_840127 [Suillus subalutaceus]
MYLRGTLRGVTEVPVTPPPIIRSLSRYVHLVKAQHKPYERHDPSTLQHHFAASQLSPIDSRIVSDVWKAVITKQADVEWRCVHALATAWEIQAIKEHKRFLQIVLEDDGDTYASAASEPWGTSLQELSRGSVDELDEHLHFCMAVYSPDMILLSVGDKQLNVVEDIARMHVDNCIAGDRFLDFTCLDDSEDQCSGCSPVKHRLYHMMPSGC